MSDLLSYAENLGSGSLNSAGLASSVGTSSSSQLIATGTKVKHSEHVSVARPSGHTTISLEAEPRAAGEGAQVLLKQSDAVAKAVTKVTKPLEKESLVVGEGNNGSPAVVAMAEQKKEVKYLKLPSPDLSKSIVPLKTPEEYAKSYKSKSSSVDSKPRPSRLFSSMGSKTSKASSNPKTAVGRTNTSVDKAKRAGSFKLGAAVQVDSSDDSADSTDDSDFQEQHTQLSKTVQSRFGEPGAKAGSGQSSWSSNAKTNTETSASRGQGGGYDDAGTDKQVTQEAAPTDSTGTVQYYQCDACDSYPLTVCRYHCLECPDYDLCETCFREGTKEHDRNHAMERLSIEKAIQKINGSNTDGPSKDAVLQTGAPEPGKSRAEPTAAKQQQAKPAAKATIVQKPRRRVRAVKAAAGAAMDMMNLTLQRCELGTARDGATSTRAAEQFNACFEAGERVFKEYGLAFAAASQHGRIIALNAMVLAGFPPHTPKHSRARTPAKPATHKAVEAIAASICDQFVIADTEEWFSTPVKKDEVPEYYEQIEEPMDLGKIKIELRMFDFSVKPVYAALALLEQRLKLIWKNAKGFNGPGHPVHKRAVALESATTRVMIQTKAALGFKDIDFADVEIPISLKTMDAPAKEVEDDTMEESQEETQEEEEEVEEVSKPRGRKRKRVSTSTSTDRSLVAASTISKETMTAQVESPVNSSSREASLMAEVAVLKKELARANARVDELYKIMNGGLTKMSGELDALR